MRGVVSFDGEVAVLWWALLACGGEGAAQAPAEASVAVLDSPFCPSFEACMEGLPAWGSPCDRWYAGDPDCAPVDWSKGPADRLDEASRGIAALRSPGRAQGPIEAGEDVDEPVPQKATQKDPVREPVPATTKATRVDTRE